LEALEFRPSSLILVLLLCGLKNHLIVDSALLAGRFLIVYLIEQGHLLVVGGPVVFYIIWSSLTVHIGGGVVGVNYGTPELRSSLGIAFDAIRGMHQASMNLKNQFVSMT
jgi:hypothetical protein